MGSIFTTKVFPGFDRLYYLSDPLVRGAFVPRLVMEFDQAKVAGLEKKYQEEQAQHLSGISDPQELMMAKLSGLTPAKRANSTLMGDFSYQLLKGKVNVKTPLRVEWVGGRAKPDDVEWGIPHIVFSSRVKNLLEKEGITGWKAYPIELYDKFGGLVEGYSALGVTGRCGPADPAKAVKRLTTYPGGVFPEYYGNYFDPESWDGSDIFIPDDGTMGTMVTERVKKLLEKNKVRHVVADTNLVDLQWEGFQIMYPELAKEKAGELP